MRSPFNKIVGRGGPELVTATVSGSFPVKNGPVIDYRAFSASRGVPVWVAR